MASDGASDLFPASSSGGAEGSPSPRLGLPGYVSMIVRPLGGFIIAARMDAQRSRDLRQILAFRAHDESRGLSPSTGAPSTAQRANRRRERSARSVRADARGATPAPATARLLTRHRDEAGRAADVTPSPREFVIDGRGSKPGRAELNLGLTAAAINTSRSTGVEPFQQAVQPSYRSTVVNRKRQRQMAPTTIATEMATRCFLRSASSRSRPLRCHSFQRSSKSEPAASIKWPDCTMHCRSSKKIPCRSR